MLRGAAVLALVACLAGGLSGCSFLKGKKSVTVSESVFSVKAGQCFNAPTTVKAELSSLTRTPCSQPHTQEAYANVAYVAVNSGVTSAPSSANSAFPGDDLLSTFAQGACAQRFTSYVGVNYLDSKLFFTYLLPSPRSWESDNDRNIICFITTTGTKLTESVKGTKQ
jgi:hypothetical protein